MAHIAVIGGGAAGLMAALAAAETAASAGARTRVTVYEAADRVGKPILATGNGRCNFSNANPDPSLYRNGSFVEQVFAAADGLFPVRGFCVQLHGGESDAIRPNAALAFWESHGLCWRRESEGRLYPLANKAASVLDVLRCALDDVGVVEACGRKALGIHPVADGVGGASQDRASWRIDFADGSAVDACAVVVAAGGAMAKTLLPSAVPRTQCRPVLGPVATDDRWTKPLDNVRVKGSLKLSRGGKVVAAERGEILFRTYGLSGIAAFNLSRLARPGDILAVDFMPDVPAADAREHLRRRAAALEASLGSEPDLGRMLTGLVLPSVGRVLLKASGLKEHGRCDGASLDALAEVLKGLTMAYRGIGDKRQCQVTRGGVDVSAVDPKTMALAGCPGIHMAGEALDVDAPCGGYNLHWAWTSALVAGRCAVEGLMDGGGGRG